MVGGKSEVKCQLESRWKVCCCTCKYQALIRDDETQLPTGYGCTTFMEVEQLVYVGNFDHGMCELHTPGSHQ